MDTIAQEEEFRRSRFRSRIPAGQRTKYPPLRPAKYPPVRPGFPRPRFPRPGLIVPAVGLYPDRYYPDYPPRDRPAAEPPSPPSGAGPAGAGPEGAGQPVEEPASKGSEFVRWLQSSLNSILGAGLPVDGIMSPDLRRAIHTFQSKNGIPADGIVGPDTERAIQQARQNQAGKYGGAPAGDSGPQEEISVNRRSREYIRWVQGNLNRILGTSLGVDGLIGPQTRSAIKQFQERSGLRPDGLLGPQTEQALTRAGSGSPPGAVPGGYPAPAVPPVSPGSSTPALQTLKNNIVRIALQEYERWGRGAIKERDPRNLSVLQDYWARGPRVQVSLAELASPGFQSEHPWSAAFISWVMRQAGAGDAFRYSAAHAVYVKAAKDNRLANNANPFKAYRINEIRPQVGDLVCKSRAGSGATYDNVQAGQKTHCDIVVGIEGQQLQTIGGNVDNSVSMTRVPLDANGYISKPGYFAVIRIGGLTAQGGAPAPQPGRHPAVNPPIPAPVGGAPRLIRQENLPFGRTLYLEIDLDIRDKSGKVAAQPMTGLFIPQGFRPGALVDLIVYLHGFKHPTLTIDQYWDSQRPKSFPLREKTSAANKNVILVAPTIGYRSQSGKLTRPGGFDAFIDAVLAALRAYGSFGAVPRLGSLVLACHSGGGWPMRQIAVSGSRYAANIRELWGFDCTYNTGDDRAYAGWARARSDRKVYIYYLANTRTAILALSLKRMNVPNVSVTASPAGGHNAVPGYHWSERVSGAPFFSGLGSAIANEVPAWRNQAFGGV